MPDISQGAPIGIPGPAGMIHLMFPPYKGEFVGAGEVEEGFGVEGDVEVVVGFATTLLTGGVEDVEIAG
jgi:hypothetical protein